jgi:TPR repeat protein
LGLEKKMRIPSFLALFTSCLLLSANVTAQPFESAAAYDFDVGAAAYDRGDYGTAFRNWKPYADQGNAEAQYNLGLMYRVGRGVLQDDKEAVKWFAKAAEQGVAIAQFSLASMHYTGRGVPLDDREAIKWYTKAAEQGFAAAQLYSGLMHNTGRGVP